MLQVVGMKAALHGECGNFCYPTLMWSNCGNSAARFSILFAMLLTTIHATFTSICTTHIVVGFCLCCAKITANCIDFESRTCVWHMYGICIYVYICICVCICECIYTSILIYSYTYILFPLSALSSVSAYDFHFNESW